MAKLTDEQRAALPMIAASSPVYSLSTMVARGFAVEMLQGLVRGISQHEQGCGGPGKDRGRIFADHGGGLKRLLIRQRATSLRFPVVLVRSGDCPEPPDHMGVGEASASSIRRCSTASENSYCKAAFR
jgi:hypothetical protein